MTIDIYVNGTPYRTFEFEAMPRVGEFVELPEFGRTAVAAVLHTPGQIEFQAQISVTTAQGPQR